MGVAEEEVGWRGSSACLLAIFYLRIRCPPLVVGPKADRDTDRGSEIQAKERSP